jgi:hypothetical protein
VYIRVIVKEARLSFGTVLCFCLFVFAFFANSGGSLLLGVFVALSSSSSSLSFLSHQRHRSRFARTVLLRPTTDDNDNDDN